MIHERVTVIVPTHNRTHLLPTTLRTVLWQQDVDVEVIVVDDGSSNDVRLVLDQIGDGRLQLIRHDVCRGVSTARNTGVANARTAWLAFCDDDDLWAPDKLASQLAAGRSTGRSWAYGGAVNVAIDLRVLAVKHSPSPDRLMAMLPRWSIMTGGASNVIVRADTLAAAGGWDPRLINLADWDLWIRLTKQGPPACVNRPLVGYRIHSGNASADTNLILREARLIDGRYGARLDYAALHHYLAWVHLRNGRRRPAVAHFIHAAVRGDVLEVARSLVALASGRIRRIFSMLQPQPSRLDREWIAEAEEWISRLSGAGVQRQGSAAGAES